MINSLHGSTSAAAAAAGGSAAAAAAAAADEAPGRTRSLPDVDTTTAATPLCDLEHGDDGSNSTGTGSSSSSSSSSAAAGLASRKVKVLAYTALGSFLFDAFKW